MAKAGAGHCIRIDPGVHAERWDHDDFGSKVEWIADFYDERYYIDADVIVCRHTLDTSRAWLSS